VPAGTIFQALRVTRSAIQQAQGQAAPPPFAWHDAAALADLFGPYGFSVAAAGHPLTFQGPSAAEYLAQQESTHPMSLAAEATLGPKRAQEVRAEMLRILEEGNEVADGFRVTSRYVVAALQR
jgi:hypothetical protein